MKRSISTLLSVVIVLISLFTVSTVSTSAAVLKAPIITKTESVADGIAITWAKVSGAAKYRVFLKTGNHWKRLGDTQNTAWKYRTAQTGQSFTFTVRCISADGKRFTSYYNKAGTSVKHLATPNIIKSEAVANGTKITWSKSAGAENYRVFIKKNNRWKAIGNTKNNWFINTNVVDGERTTYTVRCISKNGKAFTSYFNAKGFSALYNPTPQIIKVEGVSNGTKITWSKSAGAENYRVFIKKNNRWKAIGNTKNNWFINANVADGESVTYTVRCVSKDGKAFTSYFTTGGASALYNAAPVLTDLSSTGKGLCLTWQKGKASAVYRVFVKRNGHWKAIAETTDHQYTDSSVENGKSYTYTVRCISPSRKYFTSDFNRNGITAKYISVVPAEPVDPTVPAEPTEPTKPSESYVNYIPAVKSELLRTGKIKLSWERVDGIYAYAVYFKDGNTWKLMDGEAGYVYYYPFDKAGEYTFAVVPLDPADDKVHISPDKATVTVKVKYVVDQKAYSYEKPITKEEEYCCCNVCGADVTGDENGKVGNYDPEHSDMYMVLYHAYYENCSGSWHTDYRTVITGYETVNVPEKGHFEIA